jgi:hypothetical protein
VLDCDVVGIVWRCGSSRFAGGIHETERSIAINGLVDRPQCGGLRRSRTVDSHDHRLSLRCVRHRVPSSGRRACNGLMRETLCPDQVITMGAFGPVPRDFSLCTRDHDADDDRGNGIFVGLQEP